MSLRLSPFSENPWAGDWTIFYWAWWIAWAPFVGAFIARVSLGRTVKEFVLGVVFAPSLLGFVWFAIFGGAALQAEIFGQAELLTALSQGYETVLFVLFNSLPGSILLSTVALLLLLIFFVTSADSAVLILASMSTEEAGDPPLSRRIVWGVAIAFIACAFTSRRFTCATSLNHHRRPAFCFVDAISDAELIQSTEFGKYTHYRQTTYSL